MEELNLEQKNIIDYLVNKFARIITLNRFKDKIDSFIKRQYNEGLDLAGVKFNMNFVPNDKQLKFLQDYVFNNLGTHTDQIGDDLRKEISRGLLNGDTTEQLKKKVSSVFDDKKYSDRLKTVLRTEGQRANESGSYQGALQSGLKLEKYLDVVVQPGVTSDICMGLHKKYGDKSKSIPIDDNFTININGKEITAPHGPFHPNCRTTTRYIKVSQKEAKSFLEKSSEAKSKIKSHIYSGQKMINSIEERERLIKSDIDDMIREKNLEILERKSRLLKKLEDDANA